MIYKDRQTMSDAKHLNYWIVIPPSKDIPTFKGLRKSRLFRYGSTFNLIKTRQCKKNKDNCSTVHKRNALNGTIDCYDCTTLTSMWETDPNFDRFRINDGPFTLSELTRVIHIAQCFNCESYFSTPDIFTFLKRCTQCKRKFVCLRCGSNCKFEFKSKSNEIKCKQCCTCLGCHPKTPMIQQTINSKKSIVKPISKEQHDELKNKSYININDFLK